MKKKEELMRNVIQIPNSAHPDVVSVGIFVSVWANKVYLVSHPKPPPPPKKNNSLLEMRRMPELLVSMAASVVLHNYIWKGSFFVWF